MDADGGNVLNGGETYGSNVGASDGGGVFGGGGNGSVG